MRWVKAAALATALGGCATTAVRMHSTDELAAVTRQCGVSYGDISQFEEEPRLLFLMTVERPGQLRCVRQWAERRNLRLVYLENMERVPDGPSQ